MTGVKAARAKPRCRCPQRKGGIMFKQFVAVAVLASAVESISMRLAELLPSWHKLFKRF